MLLFLSFLALIGSIIWFIYSLLDLLRFNALTKFWQARDAQWDAQHLQPPA